MLTVTCFLWGDLYSLGDVKLLRDMVDRNLSVPHDFLCITDNPEQIEGTGIRSVAIPRLPVPGPRFAAEKLTLWSPEIRPHLGERALFMDLDCAVVGNMDDLVQRDEPLVLWRNPARQPWHQNSPRAPYNSSLMLFTPGEHPDIWGHYLKGYGRGLRGDQDVVCNVVGMDNPYWDEEDGIYRLARNDVPGSGIRGELPDNARIVFFVGSEHKPWLPHIRERYPWIAQYRI